MARSNRLGTSTVHSVEHDGISIEEAGTSFKNGMTVELRDGNTFVRIQEVFYNSSMQPCFAGLRFVRTKTLEGLVPYGDDQEKLLNEVILISDFFCQCSRPRRLTRALGLSSGRCEVQ